MSKYLNTFDEIYVFVRSFISPSIWFLIDIIISTKIHYKIAQSEFINLSVYNVLGKEAAVLVNEIQSPGTYSVVFSADNLPGGVYFYKLETQNFAQTSKMLLLK